MSAIDTPRLQQLLDPKRLPLPPAPKVLEIRAEPYVDSLGDDALRISIVLDDATTDEEVFENRLRPIESVVKSALTSEGIKLFPYFFFRRESERASAAEES